MLGVLPLAKLPETREEYDMPPHAKGFTQHQAGYLFDATVDAWRDSAHTPVGYPMVKVHDIESGEIRARRELFGAS